MTVQPTRDLALETTAAESALAEVAENRRQQLLNLPAAEDDLVAAAQRVGLEQTLAEIAAAQRRIADGTFGTCTRCHQPIAAERLEFRPWAATCISCAGS